VSAAESTIAIVDDGHAAAARESAAVRRVLANALALVVAYALPRVLTIGAVVLAARVLGAARFGVYGAAGAAAVILSILSTAGMQPLLVRELARDPRAAPRLLRAAHWIKTGLNALMLVALYGLGSMVFGLSGEALWAAMLLGVGYAVGSYSENLAAYFQAVERMHVWTAANAAYGISAGLAGALLIWHTRSLPWFCGAIVLGHVAALLWLQLAFLRDRRVRTFAVSSSATLVPGIAPLLRAALPFAGAFLAHTIFYKGDVLILSRLRSAVDVGHYTAAYKLVDIAQALALAAIIATYPRLARAAATRNADGRWAGTRLAELALILMAPAAGLAFVLRDHIISVLYGPGYTAAIAPAAFFALALVPLALNLLGGYILAATDRMKTMAALYGTAALLKLTAIALVAPRFDGAGAAAVMLCAELSLACAFLVVLQRTAAAGPGRRALLGVLSAAGACTVASLLPDPTGGVLRAVVLLGLCGAAYARLDVVPASERAVLRAALQPRARRVPALLP
jgi:O-antigen/teichoic acid export membrane protein